MQITAKSWEYPGTAPANVGSDAAQGADVGRAGQVLSAAKHRSFLDHVLRRLRPASPRSTAVIGTAVALKNMSATTMPHPGREAPAVIVPIAKIDAPDWTSRIDHIDRLMTSAQVDRLMVALPLPSGHESEAALARLIELKGSIWLVDTQVASMARDDERQQGIARRIQLAAKAAIDWFGAAILLVVLSPLLILVAALIRLTSHGPALFVQRRLGQNNLVIPVMKFRTMYADRGDRSGGCRTVPNDPRVTPLGRILRRWSLDELPQLFNVLLGHMSLVGPRPHAVMMKAGERLYFEALPTYLRRHRVKPGITGWAQVNRLSGQIDSLPAGRNRLEYDLFYIENWSIWLDIKIFFQTSTVFFDRVNRY